VSSCSMKQIAMLQFCDNLENVGYCSGGLA
jgi:hypothetical protein